MVKQVWDELPVKYRHVELDAFIIMPNHVHGIIITIDQNRRGEVTSPGVTAAISSRQIQGGETPPLQEKYTLGQIVAYFKYQSSKHINTIRNSPGIPVWQRNYYEHIIRNEIELDKTREYIVNNPLNWPADENYMKSHNQ